MPKAGARKMKKKSQEPLYRIWDSVNGEYLTVNYKRAYALLKYNPSRYMTEEGKRVQSSIDRYVIKSTDRKLEGAKIKTS